MEDNSAIQVHKLPLESRQRTADPLVEEVDYSLKNRMTFANASDQIYDYSEI